MAKRFGWYVAEQLVLTITLAGSRPKIWRRVEVHSSLTLEELHYVIQDVFDWQHSHLYQFLVPPGGKLTMDGFREATRYMIPPPPGVPVFPEDESTLRADEQLVGRAFTDDCDQIVYEYDFGDSWEHVVKLEKRTHGGDQDFVPVCLDGENSAPIEDSGGIDGYYLRLGAFADKSHEMHEETVDWLGEDFVAAPFDLGVVNKRLKATFKPAPKKPRKTAGKKKSATKNSAAKPAAKAKASNKAKVPTKAKALKTPRPPRVSPDKMEQPPE